MNKRLLRKRFILIDETINKICSLTHLGNSMGFMIGFFIIILVDSFAILWLFSKKGLMYNIDPTVKTSIFTLIVSSSFSFITLLYFRHKDKKREYDKVKTEIYNEVLRMFYINNEIINEHFVAYIEKDTEMQTIKRHPTYKLWHDIKHDYRSLLIDSLLNNYMNEIYDSYDEYFNFYKISENELYIEIMKILNEKHIGILIPSNCGCILYDCVDKNSDKLVDNLLHNNIEIKKRMEINNLIINSVKTNTNYNKMIEAYNKIKNLHRKAISFLQAKILDYYY